jgi:Asp-tRNA(Asn)/Glu-tRNA(Gln) amidotransferase A subunit family amidase
MGLQVIGPPRGDLRVLQAAARYEAVCPWISRLPNWMDAAPAGVGEERYQQEENNEAS